MSYGADAPIDRYASGTANTRAIESDETRITDMVMYRQRMLLEDMTILHKRLVSFATKLNGAFPVMATAAPAAQKTPDGFLSSIRLLQDETHSVFFSISDIMSELEKL